MLYICSAVFDQRCDFKIFLHFYSTPVYVSHLHYCSDLSRNHVLVVAFSITKIGPINPGLKVDQVLSSTSSDLPEKALRSHTLDNFNSSGKLTSTSSGKHLRTNSTCPCIIAYLAAASGRDISSLSFVLFLLNPAPSHSFAEITAHGAALQARREWANKDFEINDFARGVNQAILLQNTKYYKRHNLYLKAVK